MEQFMIECPPFVEMQVRTQIGAVQREYAHPIDAQMVRILDNPVINMVFKPLMDLNVDASMGQYVASGIPVNEKSYPLLNAIVDDCVRMLGIKRPYVVVTNGMEGINAMTFGSDQEPYIAVSSLLLRLMSPEQVRFVIGHECGHIAMGHVIYHSVINMAGGAGSLLPVIGPMMHQAISVSLAAWSRRSEISADRAGLLCCGDVEVAKGALFKLEVGYGDEGSADIDAYVEHSKRFLSGSALRRFAEYMTTHPLTAKRIEALSLFGRSQRYCHMAVQPVPEGALDDGRLAMETENILNVMEAK